MPSLDPSYSFSRAVFNLLSLIQSLINCINWTDSASRTVQSSFYSTASNCSLWADCCFPNYGRTSSPTTTRDLNFARVFIIRVKTRPPTHLKSSLDIKTNTSTPHWSAWRPKRGGGFPNTTAAQPFLFFSVLFQLQRVIFHTSLPGILVHLYHQPRNL